MRTSDNDSILILITGWLLMFLVAFSLIGSRKHNQAIIDTCNGTVLYELHQYAKGSSYEPVCLYLKASGDQQ